MIFKRFRELLVFTRQERNGLLILLFLLLVSICFNWCIPFLIPVNEYDVSSWKAETEKYYAGDSVKNVPEKMNFEGIADPNRIGLKELQQLGIPAGIAANWMKYLQKGGRFYKTEGLRKLYGMTDELYMKIAGHLEIADTSITQKKHTFYAGVDKRRSAGALKKDTFRSNFSIQRKEIPKVGINAADSVQLEALPGIGPVLASRIIKYRKLLGGFYEVAQLKEIYGMSEELWIKCSPFLFVDPEGMRGININFSSVTELGRHPYIGFKQAKKVVRTRDLNGKFTGKEDLAACFSADSLQRLLPYLSVSAGEP